MISKADAAFARYKDEYPHQVNYLSRRHAHIFLKNGVPFVEDLGSTNGTMVNGESVQEKQLNHGDRLTIGQNAVHFALIGV